MSGVNKMGYRHQVMSGTMVPRKDQLPKWFLDKYDNLLNFDNEFWCSFKEVKRYGNFIDLEKDIQKIIIELKLDNIRLVFFADESSEEFPDISHVTITTNEIVEIFPDEWNTNYVAT